MAVRSAPPLLFLLPPEVAHDVALTGSEFLAHLPGGSLPRVPVDAFGLRFPNPVGLAAGLDKDAEHIDAWHAMGFGFVEVGTVTPRPQPGNPKPRLFRLESADALINRMGFNNAGMDAMARRLEARRSDAIVGVNVGKNRDTDVADAAADYLACVERLYGLADYLVVNVSSPNTPGLRSLQTDAALRGIVERCWKHVNRLSAGSGRKPVLVKVAPDFDAAGLDELASTLATLAAGGLDGVIATNTTLSRPVEHRLAAETGGLSGAPLRPLATHVLEKLHAALDVPLVGVGGIMTAADVTDRLARGATLVQVYTGFIYGGPGLVRRSVQAIAAAYA